MNLPFPRRPESFDLRQLRCFLAVIDTGNFSRAAIRLGVSQQAISQIIRGLEAALGVRLLDRNPRFAAPTASGSLLLEHARRIIAECATVEERISHALGAREGQVCLGASPTASVRLVTEALLSLKRHSKTLSVDVVSATLHSVVEALTRGDVDLFVGLDNGEVISDGLVKRVLGSETYCVVTGAQHPFARRPEVSVEDFAKSEWILGHHLGVVGDEWRQAFESKGLAVPAVEITTSSVEFCKAMLVSSDYLTVLPIQLIETDLENSSLKSIATEGFQWERPIAMFYRIQAAESNTVRTLIDAMHRAAAKLYRQPTTFQTTT